MKKSTIKLIAMLLTVVLMLPNFAGAGALNENEVDFEERVSELKYDLYNLIDSRKIFDLGLYSTISDALWHISISDDRFSSFGFNAETLAALMDVFEEVEDENIGFLIERWIYEIISSGNYGIDTLWTGEILNSEDYKECTIKLSQYKSVTGKKYDPKVYKPIPEERPTDEYPSAIRIGAESRYYNCMSYAWYLYGNVNSRANYWFDEHIASGFTTNPVCFTDSDSTSDIKLPGVRVGDIVTYTDYHLGVQHSQTAVHSAIVTAVNSNGITVKSKWGIYGVYEHKLEDCPYFISKEITDYETVFTIYNMSHQFKDTSSGYICKTCGAHAY